MIPSTITAAEAGATMWDVAVIGAGPAGSACAATCAGAGARTVLVDRASFPREKVCGCCLGARGVAFVDSMVGPGAIACLGAVALTGVEIRTARRHALVRLAGGVAIGRNRLDAMLLAHAAARGSALLLGVGARLAQPPEPDHRILALSSGGVVRARMVVAADGLAGRSLADEPGMEWRIARGSRMGAGCTIGAGAIDLPPGKVVMSCAPSGYVGMVRLDDGAIDVACALDPSATKQAGGPDALASRIVRSAGVPWPEGKHAWRGVPALSRRRSVAGHRVLAIGDAAGYVEPFTGEGMTWSLESAALAAPLAVAGARAWTDRLADAWRHRRRGAIGRRQVACHAVAAALRRPRALDLALLALRRAPDTGDAIATALHGRWEAA